MLNWLCSDRDKVGGCWDGDRICFTFNRSSQITELGPKISELFIQLLKCYRLLGNITIDSEFEVWTKWVPITKTKGAGKKNISEFRTWRHLAVLSTRSREDSQLALIGIFINYSPFLLHSYKYGKKIGTRGSRSHCYYRWKIFLLSLLLPTIGSSRNTENSQKLWYFWMDFDASIR